MVDTQLRFETEIEIYNDCQNRNTEQALAKEYTELIQPSKQACGHPLQVPGGWISPEYYLARACSVF